MSDSVAPRRGRRPQQGTVAHGLPPLQEGVKPTHPHDQQTNGDMPEMPFGRGFSVLYNPDVNLHVVSVHRRFKLENLTGRETFTILPQDFTEVVYVGCSTMRDVFNLSDVRHNEAYEKARGGSAKGYISITIEGIFKHKVDAMLHAQRLRWFYRPTAHGSKYKSNRVQCIETGVIYPNQRAASEAVGVAYGSMSMHLNGRKGYETLRGMSFKVV